jgi:hypothetical protein
LISEFPAGVQNSRAFPLCPGLIDVGREAAQPKLAAITPALARLFAAFLQDSGGLSSMQMILAYFDPGPGSLLVQALVGGTAGILVFGKYLWNSASARFRAPELTSISADSSGEIPQEILP